MIRCTSSRVIRRCALALLSLLAACATVRTEENLVSSDPVEPAASAAAEPGASAAAEAAAPSAIDHSDLIDDGASYPPSPMWSAWRLSSGYRWTTVGYSIGPTSFSLSACTAGALPYYHGSAFDDVPYPDVRGGFFPAGSNGPRNALGGPLGWYPYGLGCAPAYYVGYVGYVGSPSATDTRASWTHPLDTALVFTTARAAIRPLGTGVRVPMGVVAPELAGGLGRAESGDVRRAEPRTVDRVATKAPAAEGESRGQPRAERRAKPRAEPAPGPPRSPTTSVGRRF